MDYGSKIFNYCERAQNAAFWAEPLNAVSNAAFLIAALLATVQYFRRPKGDRGAFEAILIGLVFIIGVGSFLFHTFATRWAAIADVTPIALFMFSYFGYALRRFLRLPWWLVGLCLTLFMVSLSYAGSIECRAEALLPITAVRGGRCLNGTLAYAPALIAMLVMSGALALQRHPASRLLAIAAYAFLTSMAFRTLDFEFCDALKIGGNQIGTHFLWHAFNALTLYLLLFAAIAYGRQTPKAKTAA